MDILGILIGILVIIVAVWIHECGHLLTALFFRIPVKSFQLGFGPVAKKLFYWKRVCFQINWIPLGGMVEFYQRREVFNLRKTSYELRPPWQRLVVSAGGPLMNVLFAFVLTFVLIVSVGFEVPINGIIVSGVYAGGPADTAKILVGDEIVSINGIMTSPDIDISDIAIANKGKAIPVVLIRGGSEQTVELVPGPWQHDGASMEVGYGISVAQKSRFESIGAGEAFAKTVEMSATYLPWYRDPKESNATDASSEKPNNDADEIVGVVGMVRYISEAFQQYGWWSIIVMAIGINWSLCFFNLIPFPGLDGSHILMELSMIVTKRRTVPTWFNALSNIGLYLFLLFIAYLALRDLWYWLF
jgi:regulator of sigma E protease